MPIITPPLIYFHIVRFIAAAIVADITLITPLRRRHVIILPRRFDITPPVDTPLRLMPRRLMRAMPPCFICHADALMPLACYFHTFFRDTPFTLILSPCHFLFHATLFFMFRLMFAYYAIALLLTVDTPCLRRYACHDAYSAPLFGCFVYCFGFVAAFRRRQMFCCHYAPLHLFFSPDADAVLRHAYAFAHAAITPLFTPCCCRAAAAT